MFLAYLTYNVDGNAVTDIPFDTEAYDDGDNYNPSTGIYTVPYDGLYLIHARVLSSAYNAAHWIKVDGAYATTSSQYDLDYQYQSASTSIVLHLVAEQEVAVEPVGGTIDGSTFPWDQHLEQLCCTVTEQTVSEGASYSAQKKKLPAPKQAMQSFFALL